MHRALFTDGAVLQEAWKAARVQLWFGVQLSSLTCNLKIQAIHSQKRTCGQVYPQNCDSMWFMINFNQFQWNEWNICVESFFYFKQAFLLKNTLQASPLSPVSSFICWIPQLSDWADVTSSKKYLYMKCNIPSFNCWWGNLWSQAHHTIRAAIFAFQNSQHIQFTVAFSWFC